MAETDPINVTLTADAADLAAGLNEGARAMNNFGDSADEMAVRVEGASRNSKTLFRGMVELRVALSSTEHVLKLFGVQNQAVSNIMAGLNAVMDIGITIMAIYRAASFLKENAHWNVARAALAESAAEAGTISFGAGIAIVAAAGLAAFAAITAFSPPRMAQGGIVMPRSGGTLVRVGEAGYPEAVVPLKAGTTYGDTHVTMNVYSNDPEYISRQLARLIEQRRAAGY